MSRQSAVPAWRHLALLLLVCCFGALRAADQPPGQPLHVALLADGDTPPPGVVIERLEAALSGRPGVALVERGAVAAVLREQTLRSTIGGEEATRIGELVRADLLLLVGGLTSGLTGAPAARSGQRPPDTDVRVRAIECRTGIVVRSRIIAATAADAAGVVAVVDEARASLRSDPARRRYVSLLGVRSEEGGAALDGQAAALAACLRNDLLAVPEVVVLEREAADRLAREQDLTSRELALVPASRLLEVGLRHQDGDGTQLVFTLTVRQPGKAAGPPVRGTVAAADSAALRRALAAAALTALDTAPATPPATAGEAKDGSEAKELLRQTRILTAHGELAEAEQALRAAELLDPATTATTLPLWQALGTAAYQRMESASLSQAAELRRQALRAAFAEMVSIYALPPAARIRHTQLPKCFWEWRTRDALRPPPGDMAADGLWRDLQRLVADQYRNDCERAAGDADKLIELRFRALTSVKEWGSPEMWKELLDGQLALYDQDPPEDGTKEAYGKRVSSAYLLDDFWTQHVAPSYVGEPWEFADDRQRELAEWMLGRLEAHHDVMHRIAGCNLRFQLEGSFDALHRAVALFNALPAEHPYRAVIIRQGGRILGSAVTNLLQRDRDSVDEVGPLLDEVTGITDNQIQGWSDPLMWWLESLHSSGRFKDFTAAAIALAGTQERILVEARLKQVPEPWRTQIKKALDDTAGKVEASRKADLAAMSRPSRPSAASAGATGAATVPKGPVRMPVIRPPEPESGLDLTLLVGAVLLAAAIAVGGWWLFQRLPKRRTPRWLAAAGVVLIGVAGVVYLDVVEGIRLLPWDAAPPARPPRPQPQAGPAGGPGPRPTAPAKAPIGQPVFSMQPTSPQAAEQVPGQPPAAVWNDLLMKPIPAIGWPTGYGMLGSARTVTRVAGRINAAVLDGQRLLVVRPLYWHDRPDEVKLRLLAVPLGDGPVTALGEAWLPWAGGDTGVAPQIAVAEDGVWLAAAGAPGLVRVAPDGARTWSTADGLPFGAASALACLDGMVYAGTAAKDGGAGSLVAFDPRSGASRLLATSRATAANGPLDGGEAYAVSALLADPRRHCLWIGIDAGMSTRSGLWRYDLKGGLRKIAAVGQRVGRLSANDGRLAVALSSSLPDRGTLLLFDPEHESVVTRMAWNGGPAVPFAGQLVSGSWSNAGGLAFGPTDAAGSLLFLPDGQRCGNLELLAASGDTLVCADLSRSSFWLARPRTAVADPTGWVPAASGHDARRQAAWEHFREAQSADYTLDRPTTEQLYRVKLPLYDQAVAEYPGSYLLLLARSTLHLTGGAGAAALADAEAALAVKPGDPDALCNRGLARAALRDWDAAFADLRQAAAVDTQPEIVRYRMQLVERDRTATLAPTNGARLAAAIATIDDPRIAELARGLAAPESAQRTKVLQRFADREMDPAMVAGMPALVVMLDDPSQEVVSTAVYAMGWYGTAARPAIPRLVELINERTAVRGQAAWVLGQIAERPDLSVPALAPLLDDPEENTRFQAIIALGRFGPAAKAHAGRLAELVRTATTTNLMAIAATAHWRVSGDTAVAMPRLLKALDSRDMGQRIDAANALADIGPAALEAVPGLILVLQGKEPWSEMSAACALADIGPGAAAAVPVLDALVRRDEIPEHAAFARWRITGQDLDGTLAVLVRGLATGDYVNNDFVRVQMTLSLLGDLGPLAAPAVPAITATRRDGSGAIERWVRSALRKIQAPPERAPAAEVVP